MRVRMLTGNLRKQYGEIAEIEEKHAAHLFRVGVAYECDENGKPVNAPKKRKKRSDAGKPRGPKETAAAVAPDDAETAVAE